MPMADITEAQRRLLDAYPKFTDGDPVLPGDVFVVDGRMYELDKIEIDTDACVLWDLSDAPRAMACRPGASNFERLDNAKLRDPRIPAHDTWGLLWRDSMTPGGVDFDLFTMRARALRKRELERGIE